MLEISFRVPCARYNRCKSNTESCMPQTIAVVEDDPDQCYNVAVALEGRGYKVLSFGDRASALKVLLATPPDLAVLDIRLGSEIDGGFDLCRELLARHPDLPVIFLSSRNDDIDRISGLRLGAWDYQSKPVSLSFLAEKVASLLRIRRSQNQTGTSDAERLSIGALDLDGAIESASWRTVRLDLTATEYRILDEIVRQSRNKGASYDMLAAVTLQ